MGGGYFGGAGEVYYVTSFLFQEIEFAYPVVAHNKCIYVIFVYVASLLFPVFLRDYKVYVSYGFQKQFSLLVGEVTLFIFFLPVEFICGQYNYKIISESLGASKEIDVTIV